MAFDDLKKVFKSKLQGVGEDRIAVRTQGCWNCVHASYEGAKDLWWNKARKDTLAKGAGIAATSPFGENDERVKAIRRNVPLTDTQIEGNQWVTCRVGKTAEGNPVADFVAATYLCGEWCARTGASLAREGGKADKLPEELMDRMGSGEKLD